MALSTSRLGIAGDTSGVTDWASSNALFLKQFAGEVITAFETANIMMGLHTVRTISSGKSAQFPVIGTAEAKYHTPGNSVIEDETRAEIQHNERTIGIDDLLLSAAFVDSLEEAKNHYDYRSEYTRKLGYALAKKADQQLLSVVANAAEGGAASPQAAGGASIEITAGSATADAAMTSAQLVTALFTAAARLDASDVPDQDRYVVFSPTLYYNLISNGSTGFGISTSVANSDIGGSGFGSGKVPMIAGFEIYKSNNLPTTNQSDEAGVSSLNDYSHSASSNALKGVAFHRSAVGTVKLKDLALETEYQVERQGSLMVAKYAMGHGILRPDASIILIDTAS
jgi:hypothetical protein|tara:strand:+ start:6361 stop:7380 length:1020 start_codon:yes stop_codon:yes gene_type:complete